MPPVNEHFDEWELRREEGRLSLSAALDVARRFVRVLAAGVGLLAVVAGVICALQVFGAVSDAVRRPETLVPVVENWEALIGAQEISFTVDGEVMKVSRPLAVASLALGALVLTWISLCIIIVGGKTVSLISGEREAVKKILEHAFGPSRRPLPGPAEQRVRRRFGNAPNPTPRGASRAARL